MAAGVAVAFGAAAIVDAYLTANGIYPPDVALYGRGLTVSNALITAIAACFLVVRQESRVAAGSASQLLGLGARPLAILALCGLPLPGPR